MTSRSSQETIGLHVLPNISGSKGYQAIKFSHFIEHYMRKFFHEKSHKKCAGETFPRSFPK